MDEPDFISSSTIAIIGLGLMGGSLAMALHGKCKKLLGIDPDPESQAYALDHNIVDQACADPGDILPQANVVILAAPVSAIIQWIVDLPIYHPGEAIVLDIGSTKRDILHAMKNLPLRFSPIGGHPVCGKEILSIRNAEAAIFDQASFIFSPLERTPEHTILFARQLAQTLGAVALWLPADQHDCIMAATSHVPYLIGSALALATSEDFGPYIGCGFRSTARLAATPSSMMLDVIKTNRDNVISSLQHVCDQINLQLSSLKASDDDRLLALLDNSRQHMEGLLHNIH